MRSLDVRRIRGMMRVWFVGFEVLGSELLATYIFVFGDDCLKVVTVLHVREHIPCYFALLDV